MLDVVALRESLGLAQWDLAGHSWGGGIALLAGLFRCARCGHQLNVFSIFLNTDIIPAAGRCRGDAPW